MLPWTKRKIAKIMQVQQHELTKGGPLSAQHLFVLRSYEVHLENPFFRRYVWRELKHAGKV